MPLLLDKQCPDEKEGNLFYVIRLRADGRLLLCCDECESRWRHPDMRDESEQVACSPYSPLPQEDWDYATWEDVDHVGWNRNLFRYATWADSDKS